MSETLYTVESDGEILETTHSRDEAIDARVRWMDGYPDVMVREWTEKGKGRI